MYQQKRAAAIHDLSGYGRCALSVVLPVLSVFGLETVAVPTAVLSTQTDGFSDIASRELTDYMREVFAHYQQLELSFDYIYSGYLGNEKQIQVCQDFFSHHPEAFVLVDPVMGDDGEPYSTMGKPMQRAMRQLVQHADVTIPNVTEACLLLEQEYCGEKLTVPQCKKLLQDISQLGPKWVVITGIVLTKGKLTNVAFNRETNSFYGAETGHVPVSYPGTGDIYASTVLGGISRGLSLPKAMTYAAHFLKHIVRFTYEHKTTIRDGVMLEPCLGWLYLEDTKMDYFTL